MIGFICFIIGAVICLVKETVMENVCFGALDYVISGGLL